MKYLIPGTRLVFAFATSVVIATGAAISHASAAETWNFYTPSPTATTDPIKDMNAAAAEIEKETNGELKIVIHLGGSLQIQGTDVAQAVSDNIVQAGDDQLYAGAIPIGGVTSLPALIQSQDDSDKANAILEPYVDAAFKKYNVTRIATFYFPPAFIFSRSKIASLGDIKGAKIRTYSPETSEIIQRFGGTPVALAFGEVAPAINRGVVDGIVTTTSTAYVFKDLVKYEFALPLNFTGNDFIIANTDALNKLSPKNRNIVARVFKETMSHTYQKIVDGNAALLQKMVEGGLIVVNPPASDIPLYQKNMSSYWADWAKARGPDAEEVLGKIRAAINR